MIPLCIKDEFEESSMERRRHTVMYVEELTTQTTMEALE
jgi:hypothetical protein